MPRPILPRDVILALALLLPACAAHREPTRYEMAELPASYGGVAYDAEVEAAPAAAMDMPMAKSAPAPSRSRAAPSAPMMVGGAPPPPPPESSPTGGEDAAEPSEARMVRYDGFARLRVGALEQTSDQLVALTTEVGGRVESLSRTRLVLRVPVASFRDRFDAMIHLGEVMEKNISAQDVTDAFAALDLRLKSAKAAQERLQALLAKSKDEREKLMLLRELQRLGEEIDAMEAQSRTLADLASMSRITIELVPREALVAAGPVQETSAFGWIRRLSPFRDEVLASGKRLALPVPAGLVELDLKKRFIAEAADGARVRAATLENDPEGTATFWLDAMDQRLSPEFASAERADVGEWKTLRLVDRSEEPYVYVLAVRARGRKLDVVEIYYPSAEHEKRYGEAVRAALVGGAA